jgi:hypothetical protein
VAIRPCRQQRSEIPASHSVIHLVGVGLIRVTPPSEGPPWSDSRLFARPERSTKKL